MLGYWALIFLLLSMLIVIAALSISRLSHIRLRPAIILPAIAALLALQGIFVLHGSIAFAPDDLPFFHKLLVAAGITLALMSLVELAKWLLAEFVARRRHIRLPEFLIDLTGWLLLFGGALVVIGEIYNIELTGLVVSSTVVSALVALSLQQILASIFAGITLQFEAPYLVQDWVEIDGHEGQVVRHNWRTLTLVTRRGGYLIMPNGKVAQGVIINHSRPDPRNAHEVAITVANEHPPAFVKQLLRDAVADIEGIDYTSPVDVLVASFSGTNAEYRIRFWYLDYSKRPELQDAVLTRAWYALNRAGIGMAKEEEPQRQAELIHQTLCAISIFEDLTEEQIQEIASRAVLRRYTAGERLVRQNDAGDSLFVIKSGKIAIYVNGAAGRPIHVADMTAGDFFGEMSMLTGAPRSASAVAQNDVEVIIIDKHAFTNVLSADPSILEALLNALDRRRTDLNSKLAADSARVQHQPIPERSDLLRRIAIFLGLSSASPPRRTIR